MLTKSSKMFTEQIFPISCHKNPNFELYFFQKRRCERCRIMQSICRERKCRRGNSFNFLNPVYKEANYFGFLTSLIREENHPGFATWFMKAFTLVLMNQEQSASCWEKIYVLFSQPGESPILFQLEGATIMFPSKDVFAWLLQRGEKKCPCSADKLYNQLLC